MKKEVIEWWWWWEGDDLRWCLFHAAALSQETIKRKSNKKIQEKTRSAQKRARTESDKQENEHTRTQQKQVMRVSFRECGPRSGANEQISVCVHRCFFLLCPCTNAKGSALSSHCRTCLPPFAPVACFVIAHATSGGLYLPDSARQITDFFFPFRGIPHCPSAHGFAVGVVRCAERMKFRAAARRFATRHVTLAGAT